MCIIVLKFKMEDIHIHHRGTEITKLSPSFLTLPQLAQVNQVFPVFGLWGVEGWMFYLASCLVCVWSGLTLTCSSDQHSDFKQLWQGRRRTVIGVGTIEASLHDQSSIVNIHHLRQLSNDPFQPARNKVVKRCWRSLFFCRCFAWHLTNSKDFWPADSMEGISIYLRGEDVWPFVNL